MKVLITGITGMIGSTFLEQFVKIGADVYGLARGVNKNYSHLLSEEKFFECDVTDRDMLEDVVTAVKPDVIIHTAAQAYNNTSWKCEYLTHMTNYIGTLNTLKCALKNGPDTKVLLCCSSAEYGLCKADDCPLPEDFPLKPISPYGVSKAGTEQLGFQYFCNYGLKVYLPRMFIHVGVNHQTGNAIQNFARQLALIKKGKQEPVMNVGRTDTARDFIDARDGVRAMMLLLEKGNPGEPVNICTGKSHTIKDTIDLLIKISGLDVTVNSDKSLYRATDEPVLTGDTSKIYSLGFTPEFTFEQTLEAVYKNWLERV